MAKTSILEFNKIRRNYNEYARYHLFAVQTVAMIRCLKIEIIDEQSKNRLREAAKKFEIDLTMPDLHRLPYLLTIAREMVKYLDEQFSRIFDHKFFVISDLRLILFRKNSQNKGK